jgi:hypothetical protein
MASSFNLLRNSRVFFTTDVAAGTGIVNQGTLTAPGTQELTILDNFSFSQGVNNDVITVSETGNTPARGQRSFNTALNPVEFSFSTYVRPYVSGTVKADESNLWNALFNDKALSTAATTIGTAATTASCTTAGVLTIVSTALNTLTPGAIYTAKGITGAFASQFNAPFKVTSSSATTLIGQYLTAPANAASLAAAGVTVGVSFTQVAWNENVGVAADTSIGNTAYSELTTARSNINQLLPFGLVVVIDSVTYVIDNAALDQASIDFGLDGIATVQWTGKATALRQLAQTTIVGTTLTGGAAGTVTGKSAAASTRYITNKLSTVAINANIGGGGTTYNVPITGGSIQISNNINYVTPANLGVVNTPIGYYTGSRAITGSLNAYLRAGTGSGQLMSDMLAVASTTIEPKFQLSIAIGGSTNATRVEVLANGASLQIPTIDAQSVISTVINFTVQGADAIQGIAGAAYDLEATNDLRIRYFSN